jgi:hypothetical protein
MIEATKSESKIYAVKNRGTADIFFPVWHTHESRVGLFSISAKLFLNLCLFCYVYRLVVEQRNACACVRARVCVCVCV